MPYDLESHEADCYQSGFVILVCALMFLASADARAADQVYNWTGLYVGGDLGLSRTSATTFASSGSITQSAPQKVNALVGSAIAGFNWDIPWAWTDHSVVVGLEMDVIGSNQKGSNGITIGTESFNNTMRIPWLATVRGRFGVPLGNRNTFLLYGTGGVGFGRFEASSTVVGPVSGELDGTSSRAVWVVGGGLEYAITRYWSWKAEYLYFETGAIANVTPSLPGGISLSTGQITGSIVRSGFNFHF